MFGEKKRQENTPFEKKEDWPLLKRKIFEKHPLPSPLTCLYTPTITKLVYVGKTHIVHVGD